MDLLYRLIALFFAIFIARYLFREKNVWNQAAAVAVLVLFVLRLLMIK
ncbi:MAG: hypothetical protein ABIF09_07165 [Gemmatimonadota bacterium]